LNLLRAATLTTPDPHAAAQRYAEWLDYSVVERGEVDLDLAAAWAAPAMAGAAFTVCRPASGAQAYLRFVEGAAPANYRPLRTFGWAAIEISVTDTLSVAERMARSPFEIIGPPRDLDGMPEIFPMQVRGPDDEIVYLTQIRSQPAGVRLAAAKAPIDRLFILVLACADLGETRRWAVETLGLSCGPEVSIRYTMISKAFDLPPEHKHAIATGGDALDVFLELDQYPPAATPRPTAPGALPPGVSIATLLHPDLDRVTGPWLSAPAPRDGALYEGRRTGVLQTPEGALLELVSLT
jgi:catechol 2,3-dioxygenase-like lactoylglutathione lyase family enzyme